MLALALAMVIASPPEIPDDAAFKPWVVENGIAELRAQVEGPYPFVRAVLGVTASCDSARELLTDFDHYRAIFDGVVRKADVLEKEEASARLHFVWDYPWPMRDRDAVVRYALTPLEGGGWLLSWKDDARPGDPSSGLRIASVEGSTRLVPDGQGCTVTYTAFGDLGIHYSSPLNLKTLQKEPAKYLLALQKGLKHPPVPAPTPTEPPEPGSPATPVRK